MTYTELHFEAVLIALLGLGVLVWILTRAKPRLKYGMEEPRFVFLARRCLFCYISVACLLVAVFMADLPYGFGVLSVDAQVNAMFDITGSAIVVYIVAVLAIPGIVGK